MNPSQQSVVGYAVLSFLTITIVFGVFNIANSDLQVPLYYGHDALEWIALLEGYLSGQHYSDLYAPLGFVHETSILISLLNWITTPFWLLAIHGLSLFERDPVWIINVYFYLSYLLTSLAMAYLLRYLRCGWPITIAVALLYAFLPYHQYRATLHLLDGSYYLVPLYTLCMLWLFKRVPVFYRFDGHKLVAAVGSYKSVFAFVVIVLISPTSHYLTFLFAVVLAIAGISATVYRKQHQNLTAAIILILLAGVSLTKQQWPHWLEQVIDADYAARTEVVRPGQNISLYGDAERFGLKVSQLLLPVDYHRIPVLAELKKKYSVSNPLVNENTSSTLGIVGSIGFLFILASLFSQGKHFSLQKKLGLITVFAILFATIGGFSSLMSLVFNSIAPESSLASIRSFNRISVFIACFSLMAVAFWFNRWQRRVPFLVSLGSSMMILVIGLLDILPGQAFSTESHARLAESFYRDQRFFHQVESSLPGDSQLFQYPHFTHHTTPRHQQGLLGKIHTDRLGWSYGGDINSFQDNWCRSTASLGLDDMIGVLRQNSFAGILVDASFNTEESLKSVARFSERLGQPVTSEDERFYFFSLQSRTPY
jgi:phosphoglycerol transferase